MARTIYGAEPFNTPEDSLNVRYDARGKNSEVFAVGDPVTVASGALLVAGTTNTIVGVAIKAATMTSSNVTVAGVTPGYIPADEALFLMGCNADLTGNGTDAGTFYKLTTATTAAVQVDVSSGVQVTTSRVVEVVKVDPFNEGGTGASSGLRQVVVRFVKTPYTNVSITA